MCSNFIFSLYIVDELSTWPRNPTNNFLLKSRLFGTVKLTRNLDKSKFTIIVDNSSSPHIDNPIDFLVLGEEPTEGINCSAHSAGKKIGTNSSKTNTKFCLTLHYNGCESYLSVNKTEI